LLAPDGGVAISSGAWRFGPAGEPRACGTLGIAPLL
jgi:hypothetical protein